MEVRIYSSDLNVQFDISRLNYLSPDQLYRTIDLIRKRYGEFEVAKHHNSGKRYLLPTGLVEIYKEGIEEVFPEIKISSRTESGLKRIVNSLSLALGHAPKKE